ncbi:hypothetical protein [Parasphingopyxis sp.]|uniref:hypothetical protein n=1 Tax=Parasphingopyxis sp. TaxID=1920299 RepID=UPI003F9FC160
MVTLGAALAGPVPCKAAPAIAQRIDRIGLSGRPARPPGVHLRMDAAVHGARNDRASGTETDRSRPPFGAPDIADTKEEPPYSATVGHSPDWMYYYSSYVRSLWKDSRCDKARYLAPPSNLTRNEYIPR